MQTHALPPVADARITLFLETNDPLPHDLLLICKRMLHGTALSPEQYQQLASPIRNIPNEVLSALFLAILPHDLGEQGRSELVSLRLTCRRWDEIALATPELWRGLIISPHDQSFPRTNWSCLEDQWGAWLKRGGSHAPLRLILGDLLDLTPEQDTQVMHFVASPERKWVTLAMGYTIDRAAVLKEALTGKDEAWSGIRELTLNSSGSTAEVSTLLHLPQLQSLSLCLYGGLIPQPGHFTTHQLKYPLLVSLHLSGLSFESPAALAGIINETHLPSLQELIIDLPFFSSHPPGSTSIDHAGPKAPVVTHIGIKRFIIQGASSVMLLPYLSFPSLNAWEIRVTCHVFPNQPDPMDALIDFSQRSTNSLQVLALQDSDLQPPDVARLVSLIPSLRHIHIKDCCFFLHLKGLNTVQPMQRVETITSWEEYLGDDFEPSVMSSMIEFFKSRDEAFARMIPTVISPTTTHPEPLPRRWHEALEMWEASLKDKVYLNLVLVKNWRIVQAFPLRSHAY